MSEECKSCQMAQQNTFAKSPEPECGCSGETHEESISLKWLILSSILLLVSLVVDYFAPEWWGLWVRPVVYLLALLPVALPVMQEAWELMRREADFFNECFLMSIAAIGAFAIGEYPEAVMLMLLFNIGEYLQGRSVQKAKRHISELVDSREEYSVRIHENGEEERVQNAEVLPGEVLRLLVGNRVSHDAQLLSSSATLDLSALTGESMPVSIIKGEKLLAGSVVLGTPIEVKVLKPYHDSTLARILAMAEEAVAKKPKTERFIRRFARIYTPIVVGIAALVVLLPYLYSLLSSGFDYSFTDWFYRSLVFLVTSCPCALAISVPLSYFSGVGVASKHGLLFKGALFLEKKIDAVVFDKTGTLTQGHFEVVGERSEDAEALACLLQVERKSTHPVAQAVVRYLECQGLPEVQLAEVQEIPGLGMVAQTIGGHRFLAGGAKLLEREQIAQPSLDTTATTVYGIRDGRVVVALMLEDQLKDSSRKTIAALRKRGVHPLVMLSGDQREVAERVGQTLAMDESHGGLLPQDKMAYVSTLMKTHRVLFVGDGLNDAPVMGMSDVGVAMGGIASDATIEAADIIIQGDNPYKLVEAWDISKLTGRVVRQNIVFALSFKFIVMILAIFGVASLPLAVMADVGVTLLTIINAMRILRYRHRE